ncbi:hypothetical protein BV22DRAFT_1051968 [Leucogyrophana mollusca]|uniref:Uncharacterized protein n=1 Tax=Leucogyrophana mollusca TaxID=85980 RepID=A0ACB8AX24_9AGAM|nr:hypothetical protein BV22DRAFT_1051968 [Leucogyrophana mollusca]
MNQMLLLTENPYPDDPQEADWSRTVWRQACKNLSFRITHTPELLKLPIIANVYGFETSADEDIQEANRKLVTALKADNAFIYREHGDSEDERKGIYANKGIQQMECAIDKWAHSSRDKVTFTKEEYKSVFKVHLQSLKDFNEHSKEYQLVPKLLQWIHDSGRVHAKAEVVGMASLCVMSKCAFDNAIREVVDNQ